MAGNQVEEGGFAGTVRADHGGDFAARDRQIDPVDGGEAIEGLAETMHFKHCASPFPARPGLTPCSWRVRAGARAGRSMSRQYHPGTRTRARSARSPSSAASIRYRT